MIHQKSESRPTRYLTKTPRVMASRCMNEAREKRAPPMPGAEVVGERAVFQRDGGGWTFLADQKEEQME